jgi:hypothetical protein
MRRGGSGDREREGSTTIVASDGDKDRPGDFIRTTEVLSRGDVEADMGGEGGRSVAE